MTKKIEIRQNEQELHLSFQWRKAFPKQLFGLGLQIAMTAAVLFAVAPASAALLWIAVFQAFFIYLFLCYLFNKTNIEVDKYGLSLRHSPIPWYKGNIKLESNTIEQLYVTRKGPEDLQTEEEAFELWARTKEGRQHRLLSGIGIEVPELVLLEQQIERFLGIPDYGMFNEFQGAVKKAKTEVRRRVWALQGMEEATPANLQEGSFADYDGQRYKVVHLSQYDWTNGNTDRLYHLKGYTGYEPDRLLHIRKHYTTYHFFIEQELTALEQRALSFDWEAMPSYFDYEGREYFRSLLSKGKLYANVDQTGIDTQEWMYRSGEDHQFRAINNDGYLSYYVGERIAETAFSNIINP